MANINSIIYKGVKYNIGDSYLVGGSGDVDLTGYATNDYVDEQIAGLNFDCNWDESRIAALEELVNQLNTRIDNISSGGSGGGSDDEGGDSGEQSYRVYFRSLDNWDSTKYWIMSFDENNYDPVWVFGRDIQKLITDYISTESGVKLFYVDFTLPPVEEGRHYVIGFMNPNDDSVTTEDFMLYNNYVYGDGDPVVFDEYVPSSGSEDDDSNKWTRNITVDINVLDSNESVVDSNYELGLQYLVDYNNGQTTSWQYIGNERSVSIDAVGLGIKGDAIFKLYPYVMYKNKSYTWCADNDNTPEYDIQPQITLTPDIDTTITAKLNASIVPIPWTNDTCTVDLTIYDLNCNKVTSDYELDIRYYLKWIGEGGQSHSSNFILLGNDRQFTFNPVELGLYGTVQMKLDVRYGNTGYVGGFINDMIEVNTNNSNIVYILNGNIIEDESIKKTIYFYDISQQSTYASLIYMNNEMETSADGSDIIKEVDGVAHKYFKIDIVAENLRSNDASMVSNLLHLNINNIQDGYIYTSDGNSYPFDEFVWPDVPEYEVLTVNGTGTLNYTQNGEAKTLELTGEETTLSTTLATPITLTSFNGAALTKLEIANENGCSFDSEISTPADFFTPSKSILTMAYVGSMRDLTWRNAFDGFSALVKLDFGPSTDLYGREKTNMGTGTNISTICCGTECLLDLRSKQHTECDFPFATDDDTYTVGAIGSGANYEIYNWEDVKDDFDQSHWIEQPE